MSGETCVDEADEMAERLLPEWEVVQGPMHATPPFRFPVYASKCRSAVAAEFRRMGAALDGLRSEITEAAYRAWPEAEDCGYDAGHIIDQLAGERDAALTKITALEAELAEVKGEIERLREGLQFYADPNNWTDDEQVNGDEHFSDAMAYDYDQHGARARAALTPQEPTND